MGFIYKITNRKNGKCYIGQTINNPQRRWTEHKRDYDKYDTHFYRAIRKYGISSFKFEIIEKNVKSHLLNSREEYWIKYYNSFECGYNSTTGGDNHYQVTEEVRQKIKKSSLGRTHSSKTKEKMSKAATGRKHTEEAKRKMSQSQKGMKLSQETKDKISRKLSGKNNPFYGRKHTDKTKKQISESKKGQPSSNKGMVDVGATSSKTVYQYDKNWNLIRTFKSVSLVLKFLGVKGHSQLYRAFRNKSMYKNYYWSKKKV